MSPGKKLFIEKSIKIERYVGILFLMFSCIMFILTIVGTIIEESVGFFIASFATFYLFGWLGTNCFDEEQKLKKELGDEQT